MSEPFPIPLADGSEAVAIRVDLRSELPAALQKLGLQAPRPAMALIGGASHMEPHDYAVLRQIFTQAIARAAVEVGAAVIDGGTEKGIMQLIGRARHELQAGFPLVGVAPFLKLDLPGMCHDPPASAQPAAHHTHFILVPGTAWGDESPWLAKVTTLLAGHHPSISLMANGGEITWQDAVESVREQRLTVALKGSGRLADRIAAALAGDEGEFARELILTGYVGSADLAAGPAALRERILGLLS